MSVLFLLQGSSAMPTCACTCAAMATSTRPLQPWLALTSMLRKRRPVPRGSSASQSSVPGNCWDWCCSTSAEAVLHSYDHCTSCMLFICYLFQPPLTPLSPSFSLPLPLPLPPLVPPGSAAPTRAASATSSTAASPPSRPCSA